LYSICCAVCLPGNNRGNRKQFDFEAHGRGEKRGRGRLLDWQCRNSNRILLQLRLQSRAAGETKAFARKLISKAIWHRCPLRMRDTGIWMVRGWIMDYGWMAWNLGFRERVIQFRFALAAAHAAYAQLQARRNLWHFNLIAGHLQGLRHPQS